jgi:hypothetical protein
MATAALCNIVLDSAPFKSVVIACGIVPLMIRRTLSSARVALQSGKVVDLDVNDDDDDNDNDMKLDQASNVLRYNSAWVLKNLVYNAPWVVKKYVLQHASVSDFIKFVVLFLLCVE